MGAREGRGEGRRGTWKRREKAESVWHGQREKRSWFLRQRLVLTGKERTPLRRVFRGKRQ